MKLLVYSLYYIDLNPSLTFIFFKLLTTLQWKNSSFVIKSELLWRKKGNLIGFMLKDMCPEYNQCKGSIVSECYTQKNLKGYIIQFMLTFYNDLEYKLN